MPSERICAKCGAAVASELTSCHQCGASVNGAHEDEYQLAPMESPAARPTAPPTSEHCPHCGESLADGAVLCVACGYHLEKGERIQSVRAADHESADAEEEPDGLSFAASLLRGAIFSAAGAAIGAVLWIVVALALGAESGWIAWALGALAGGGMAMAHEDPDGTLAGCVAALVSLGGIFGAKLVVFLLVVAPTLKYSTIDDRALEMAAVQHLVEERTNASRSTRAALSKADVVTHAHYDAKRMTHDEKVDYLFQVAEAKEMHPDDVFPAPPASLTTSSFFLPEMFGPLDGIFMIIALATAYWVGRG